MYRVVFVLGPKSRTRHRCDGAGRVAATLDDKHVSGDIGSIRIISRMALFGVRMIFKAHHNYKNRVSSFPRINSRKRLFRQLTALKVKDAVAGRREKLPTLATRRALHRDTADCSYTDKTTT